MSSPERIMENNENISNVSTVDSKTPQPTRQGKRVPTESPYSWATPSHRKPLKQSRQPTFVDDINLEQTFLEQDTIMMFPKSDSISFCENTPSREGNENIKIFGDMSPTHFPDQEIEANDSSKKDSLDQIFDSASNQGDIVDATVDPVDVAGPTNSLSDVANENCLENSTVPDTNEDEDTEKVTDDDNVLASDLASLQELGLFADMPVQESKDFAAEMASADEPSYLDFQMAALHVPSDLSSELAVAETSTYVPTAQNDDEETCTSFTLFQESSDLTNEMGDTLIPSDPEITTKSLAESTLENSLKESDNNLESSAINSSALNIPVEPSTAPDCSVPDFEMAYEEKCSDLASELATAEESNFNAVMDDVENSASEFAVEQPVMEETCLPTSDSANEITVPEEGSNFTSENISVQGSSDFSSEVATESNTITEMVADEELKNDQETLSIPVEIPAIEDISEKQIYENSDENAPDQELSNMTDENVSASEPTDMVDENVSASEPTDMVDETVSASEPTDMVDETVSASEPTDMVDENVSAPELTDMVDENVTASELTDMVEQNVTASELTDMVEQNVTASELTDMVEKNVSAPEPTDMVEENVSAPEPTDMVDEDVSAPESSEVNDESIVAPDLSKVADESVSVPEINMLEEGSDLAAELDAVQGSDLSADMAAADLTSNLVVEMEHSESSDLAIELSVTDNIPEEKTEMEIKETSSEIATEIVESSVSPDQESSQFVKMEINNEQSGILETENESARDEIPFETSGVETAHEISGRSIGKSNADISIIRPDEDSALEDMMESEGRDMFDVTKDMHTFPSPSKGNFSDSMVEFLILENNISRELEGSMGQELTDTNTNTIQSDQADLLQSENIKLKNEELTYLTDTNISLVEKIALLENEMEQIKIEHNSQVESVTSKLINTTKELDSLRFDRNSEKNIEFNERVSELERTVKESACVVAELRMKLDQKNNELIAAENAANEAKMLSFEMQERLVADTGFLTDDLQRKKEQILSLQRELDQWRGKVSSNDDTVEELFVYVKNNFESSWNDISGDDEDDSEAKLQNTRKRLVGFKQFVDELEKAKTTSANLLEESQKSMSDLSAEFEVVKSTLLAKDTELNSLRESIRSEGDCSSSLIKDLESQVSSLTSQLSAAREELIAIEEDRKEVTSVFENKVSLINNELDTVRAQFSEETEKLRTEHQEALEVLNAKSVDIQEKLSLTEAELAEAKSSCEKEKINLANTLEEIAELKASIETKTDLLTLKEEELQTVQAKNAELEEALKSNNETEQKLIDATSKIANYESEKSTICEELDEAKAKLCLEIENKNSLIQELDVIKETLEATTRELSSKEKELSEISATKEELVSTSTKLSEIEKDLIEAVSKTTYLENDLSIAKEELTEKSNKLEEEVQKAVSLSNEIGMLKKSMEESAEALKAKDEQLQVAIAARDELAESARMADELGKKVVEATSKISYLETELNDAQELLSEEQKKVNAHKQAVVEKDQECETLRKDLTAASQLLSLKEEEYKSQSSELESLRECSDKMNEMVSNMTSTQNKDRQELDAANAKIADIQTKLAEAEKEKDNAREENETALEKISLLNSELSALKEAYEASKKLLEEKDQELKTAGTNNSELDELKEKLVLREKEFSEKLSMYEQSAATAEEKYSSLNLELQCEIAKVSGLEKERDTYAAQISVGRETLQKLEEENKVHTETIAKLTAECSELTTFKAKAVENEEQKELLTSENLNLNNRLLQHVDEKKALNLELSQSRAEVSSLKNSLEAMKLQIDSNDSSSLKSEIEKKQKYIEDLENKSQLKEEEVERLYKMCDEFDDIESELKQTIADLEDELNELKRKNGDLPPLQPGLLDVIKQGVNPLTPNTSTAKVDITTVPEEDMEEGEGFSSAPSSPTRKNPEMDVSNMLDNVTMSTTMYKKIHADTSMRSPQAKDANSSRCAQQ